MNEFYKACANRYILDNKNLTKMYNYFSVTVNEFCSVKQKIYMAFEYLNSNLL